MPSYLKKIYNMKKILVSIALLAAIGVYAQGNGGNQSIAHNGKVTGIIPLGNQEIVTVLDEETEIIYKSEPTNINEFSLNENVQLICEDNLKKAEIVKQNLTNRVFGFNDEWSKDMNVAFYVYDLDKVFLSEKGSICNDLIADNTTIVMEGKSIELPGNTKKLLNDWHNNGGHEQPVKGVFKEVIEIKNGSETRYIVCKGNSGKCADVVTAQ